MSIKEIKKNMNRATVGLKDVDITSTDAAKLSVTKEGAGTDTLTFSLTPTIGGQVDTVTIGSSDETKLKVTAGGTGDKPTFKLTPLSGKVDDIYIVSADETKLKISNSGSASVPNFLLTPLGGGGGGGQVDSVTLSSYGNSVLITENDDSSATNPSFNLESQGGGGGGQVNSVTLTSADKSVTVTKNSDSSSVNPSFDLAARGGGGGSSMQFFSETKLTQTIGDITNVPLTNLIPGMPSPRLGERISDAVGICGLVSALTAVKVEVTTIPSDGSSHRMSLKSNLNSITISPILTRKFGDDPEPEPEGYFIDVNETTENKTYTVASTSEISALLNDLNKKRINHSITINASSTIYFFPPYELVFDNFNGIGDLTFNIPFPGTLRFKNNDLDFVFNNTKEGMVIIEEENTGNIYFEGVIDSYTHLVEADIPAFKNYSPTTQLFINGYTMSPEVTPYIKSSIIDASNGSTTYINNVTLYDGYNPIGEAMSSYQYVISGGARVISQDSSADTPNIKLSDGGRYTISNPLDVDKYVRFPIADKNAYDTSNIKITMDNNIATIFGKIIMRGSYSLLAGDSFMKLLSPLLPKNNNSGEYVTYGMCSKATENKMYVSRFKYIITSKDCNVTTELGLNNSDILFFDFSFEIASHQ